MGKSHRQSAARKKKAQASKYVTWAVVALIVGAIGFGISQMSNIAFDEEDIAVVNFSGLSDGQKQKALEAANAARCTCGCGLGLAQCVSTDPACPIREGNIERIRTMVRQAQAEPGN